jgi:hypothetical protein
MKALTLLRIVAHKEWGIDSATLLELYRTHVRSKFDFGCVVYGSARSARPWAVGSRDGVQNAALRTCLVAFRTSPMPSLHVEAGELPLSLRRQQLSLQYIVKLRPNPSSTLASVVCSKLDQALSQHSTTGCNETSWIVESIQTILQSTRSRRSHLVTKGAALSAHALITVQLVRSLTNRV